MKRCKNCKSRFEARFSTLERFCWDPECKTIEAMLENLLRSKVCKAKNERDDLRKRKQALETTQQKILKTQKDREQIYPDARSGKTMHHLFKDPDR